MGGEQGEAGGGGQKTRPRAGGRAGAGSLGWGREAGMGAMEQDRKVQETSLRAQETLWWDLKTGY